MESIIKITQNKVDYEYFSFYVEFLNSKKPNRFTINCIEEVFFGENISLEQAIKQKMNIQCFIDIGESFNIDFHSVGTVSINWEVKENECNIGLIWIEPEFRSNGLATYILNEIINYADELGIILTLYALPFIGPEDKPTKTDIKKTKEYYRQFGFENHPKTKGIGFNSLMRRIPRNN